MITLEDIKQQCRIDPDDAAEDGLMARYHEAARIVVANHIDKPIFDTEQDKGDKEGVVVDKAIEQAMLLLIGHFYEHREAVADIQLYECPMGYESLLQPYRKMGV